jgi:primosomal protein N'
MISEILLGVGVLYCIKKIINRTQNKIENDFMKITYRLNNNDLMNRQEELPKIEEIIMENYGYTIIISLSWGITFDKFEKYLQAYKEGLQLDSIHCKVKKGIVTLHCIENYHFKQFEPVKLKPNYLLIGDGLHQNVIVDMNKFPHVLIGGDTGSGKSRVLLVILTNLIHTSNVSLYLLQVRKNDLGVFANCHQVKVFSKTLDEVCESLEKIDQELLRREKLIDNTRGFYNIESRP